MQSKQQKTKRNCCQQTTPKRMAEVSSLNKKDTIKEGILEYWEGKMNNRKSK